MRKLVLVLGIAVAGWAGLLAAGATAGDNPSAPDPAGAAVVAKPATSTKPAPTQKSGNPRLHTETRKPQASGKPTTTKAAPPSSQCAKGYQWNGRTCERR